MSEGIEISKSVDLSLIKESAEITLIKQILDFPNTIESSALTLEPHRLTTYLFDLANDFHKFYHDHRVVTEDKELTAARMMLCKVTKDVLASGFHILGISAPEKM
jgi:arginyl-tRNA synthetase